MQKLFFTLLSCSLLLGCSVTRVSSKPLGPPTKSYVKILHKTKIISCKKNHKQKCPQATFMQTGSGMAIDIWPGKSTVLTAGHVCKIEVQDFIEQSLQLTYVIDHTNTKHQAWPIKVSFHNMTGSGDLCVLWVPTLNVKKIKLSKKQPKIGEELFYIGSPVGVYHPPTVPIFKGIYSGKIDASSSIVTFPAIGGSSGAAVLNKKFEIVGVVFAANLRFHHISLVVNYDSLKTFITGVKLKYTKKSNNTQ